MLGGRLSLKGLVHVEQRFSKTHLPGNAMRKAEFAVRASTNAQIIAKLPIVQVVPTFVTRLGIGRHFIPLQTFDARHGRDQVHHGVGVVVFG